MTSAIVTRGFLFSIALVVTAGYGGVGASGYEDGRVDIGSVMMGVDYGGHARIGDL